MRGDRGLRWFEYLLTGSMVVLGLLVVLFGVVLATGAGSVHLPAEVAAPYGVTLPDGRVIEVDGGGSTSRSGFPHPDGEGIVGAPRVVVDADIDEDDVDTRMALGVALLAVIALTAVALVELRRVVRSARDGDPFEAANVSRIRHTAFVSFALPVVFRVATSVVDGTLDSDLDLRVQNVGGGVWTAVFVGVGLLALAQVFREGVALRELEAGTV